MDVDSTLIRGEVIELLAARKGCEAEVLTSRAERCAANWTSSRACASVRLLAGLRSRSWTRYAPRS